MLRGLPTVDHWWTETLSAIINYPIDWKTVFQWLFALAVIWAVIRFFVAAERGRKELRKRTDAP
jgi:hypothetical protein